MIRPPPLVPNRFFRAPFGLRASVLLAVGGLFAPIAPGQNVFVYALNQRGNISANAYPLDNLPDSTSGTSDQRWYDLFVAGPDRWAIRGDGRIDLNGAKVADLAYDDGWRGLVVDDQGSYVAMRKGGRIAGPDGVIVDYDAGSYSFTDIILLGTDELVLKGNGAVFRVPETDPLIKFNGPAGEISGSSGDGEAPDTTWVKIVVSPIDGQLWGLRGDGTIKSAVIPASPPMDPDPGTLVVGLPYDDSDGFIDVDDLYKDLTFDNLDVWYALRADGKLYTAAAQGPPLVDFPGQPSDNSDQGYVSVLSRGGDTLILRSDGKVYANTTTTALIDLKSDSYVMLALGDELPDLTNVKNEPPTATSTTVVAPEGADIELPVLAVDRDLPADELIVDIDPETLPEGASWDSKTRTVSWPAAGPIGKYKLKVSVDDGIAKPKAWVQTILIKPLDENENKNVKPYIAKVKRANVLVAVPFALQVTAYDRDDDAVDVSLDPKGKALPGDAAFDDMDWIFTWTSKVSDKGSFPLKLLADDGTASSKRTIKLKVETSLLAF